MTRAAWACALCEATSLGTGWMQPDGYRRATSDRAICTNCEKSLKARGRKRCRKCNGEKRIEEFVRDPRVKYDGRGGTCRACRAAYQREWSARNPERSREIWKGYRERHREQVQARERRYRKNNPERIRAKSAAYRTRNRERENARSRRYHAAHLEQHRIRARRYYRERKLRLFRQMRGAA